MALKPISTKQGRIVIDGCPGLWSSADGGNIESDKITFIDPNTGLKQTNAGTLMMSDMTLKRVYDPKQDVAAIAWCIGQLTKPTNFGITITPTSNDVQGSALGAGVQKFASCVLTKYTPPKFDREGSGVTMIEIEVSINALPTFS
jgi:hypothetical protein